MKLRRFTAMTMEEAMAQVRQTLGPDAIIVSTHETKGGRGVEVTAAIEEDMIPARSRPAPSPQTAMPAAMSASPERRPLDVPDMSPAPRPGRIAPDPQDQPLQSARDDNSALEAMARQIQARIAAQRDGRNPPDLRPQARSSAGLPDHFEPDRARDDRNYSAVASSFSNAKQAPRPAEPQIPNDAWKPLRPNWRSAPREAVVNPTPRPVRPINARVLQDEIDNAPRPAPRPQPAAKAQPQPQPAPAAPAQAAPSSRLSVRDRTIAHALDFHSVPRPIAEALFRAARGIEADDPVIALAGALESRLVFAPLAPIPRRPTMMIGPVGAGKTVAVAKIAAKAVLTGKRIEVITTDTVRAGAIAQIESYTNVLEQDLGIEETPDGLGDRLAQVANGQPVIIDTAGANPFLTHEMADLAMFIAASPDIDPILALSAGSDAREAFEVAQAFRTLGAKRLIVTRVDAARRLGSIISAADAGLTLAQISNSPYVAEGLASINPVSLADLLITPLAPAIKDHSPEAALI